MQKGPPCAQHRRGVALGALRWPCSSGKGSFLAVVSFRNMGSHRWQETNQSGKPKKGRKLWLEGGSGIVQPTLAAPPGNSRTGKSLRPVICRQTGWFVSFVTLQTRAAGHVPCPPSGLRELQYRRALRGVSSGPIAYRTTVNNRSDGNGTCYMADSVGP